MIWPEIRFFWRNLPVLWTLAKSSESASPKPSAAISKFIVYRNGIPPSRVRINNPLPKKGWGPYRPQ